MFKGLCRAVCDHFVPDLWKDAMYLYCLDTFLTIKLILLILWGVYLEFGIFYVNKRLRRMVKHIAGNGNRTRGPSHTRRRVRPLSHGDYIHLTYLSW